MFWFFFFIILVNKDHQFLNKKQTKEFTFLLNWLMCSSHDSECVLEDVNFGTLAAAFLFIGRGSSFFRWSAAEVNTVYPRCTGSPPATHMLCQSHWSITNIRENAQCRQIWRFRTPIGSGLDYTKCGFKPLLVWLPHLEKKAEHEFITLNTGIFWQKPRVIFMKNEF